MRSVVARSAQCRDPQCSRFLSRRSIRVQEPRGGGAGRRCGRAVFTTSARPGRAKRYRPAVGSRVCRPRVQIPGQLLQPRVVADDHQVPDAALVMLRDDVEQRLGEIGQIEGRASALERLLGAARTRRDHAAWRSRRCAVPCCTAGVRAGQRASPCELAACRATSRRPRVDERALVIVEIRGGRGGAAVPEQRQASRPHPRTRPLEAVRAPSSSSRMRASASRR